MLSMGQNKGRDRASRGPICTPPQMATSPFMTSAPQDKALMPVSGQASALLGQTSPKCLGTSKYILECCGADLVPFSKLIQLQRCFLGI